VARAAVSVPMVGRDEELIAREAARRTPALFAGTGEGT
jgi:hypothetical protein